MSTILQLLCEVQKKRLTVQAQKRGTTVPSQKLEEVNQAYDYMARHMRTAVSRHDGHNQLSEAMTTGDFPFALGEFIQRRMVPGYEKKNFPFEPLVWLDTVPNYLDVTRYQNRADLDDLEYVGKKGTARPGSYRDAIKRTYKVEDWEKVFDFDMHALVNDDLGYFDDLAMKMGRSARRTLEKFVSRMYTNATTIARLVALGALYSTTGRLTSDRISTARMGFNQRVDDRGEPINARLAYIVHHSGLLDTVLMIMNSQFVPENDTNAVNIVAGRFIPIEDPYIVGAAPDLPWYAFTDWRENNIRPFVLVRQQGIPAPMLLRRKSDMETFGSLAAGGSDVSPLMGDFLSGNVAVKVKDVWGTWIDATEGNLFDYRGAYYSSGTTP